METKNSAAQDLVALTLEISNPPLDANNAAFKGAKYTKLPTILDHARPVCARHNFALLQEVTSDIDADGTVVSVTSVLMHRSGERFSCGPLRLRPTKQDAQGTAGAVTYGRRITVASLLAISGDEDQDGNDVVGTVQASVSADQAANIEALLTETGADRVAFLRYFKAENVAKIPAAQYHNVVAALERKRKAA